MKGVLPGLAVGMFLLTGCGQPKQPEPGGLIPTFSLSVSPSPAIPTPSVPVPDMTKAATTHPVVATTRATAPATTRPVRRTVTTTPARRVVTTTKAPSVYYKNCSAVWDAGMAPLRKGDPGYRSGLDRDGDGVACEKKP